MASNLNEPFVYPISRDFRPRNELSFKHGVTALDEISLNDLLVNGLNRVISIYTTHLVLSPNRIINDGGFTLWNPLFKIEIPFHLKQVENQPNLPQPTVENCSFLPEKLWTAFRSDLIFSNYYYGGTDVGMIKMDFQISEPGEIFSIVSSVLSAERIKCLPLHIRYKWKYFKPIEEIVDGIKYVKESTQATPVTNVYKDFVIVRRTMNEKRTIAIGGDFHFSKRNDSLMERYNGITDINAKIRKFSKNIDKLYREGKLDYLIVNGDWIDHMNAESDGFNQNTTYEASNWGELDEENNVTGLNTISLTGCLFPGFFFRKVKAGLFHVPLMVNKGDHDRLRISYPSPANHGNPQSHYNIQRLPVGEPEEFSIYPASGESSSSDDVMRWLFELSRKNSQPQRFDIPFGPLVVRLLVLDTGGMNGDLASPPLDPLRPKGMDQNSLALLQEQVADRCVNVIITHAPPVCIPPNSEHHTEEITNINPQDALYGTMISNRGAFISFLASAVEQGHPTVVISGHVHYYSAYSLSSVADIKTGTAISADIRKLNNGELSASDFWTRHKCLLMTVASIGPDPTMEGQRSHFLLLTVGADGISKLQFKNI